MKTRDINPKKRAIAVNSMIIILLSLIVLNLNLNSPMAYADLKDQVSVKKQLLITDISNTIKKLSNYNNTLKQKVIQIQISQKSGLDNAS